LFIDLPVITAAAFTHALRQLLFLIQYYRQTRMFMSLWLSIDDRYLLPTYAAEFIVDICVAFFCIAFVEI